MASLNKVMLLGNLTRDPELRYTPKGSAVAEIGLAVKRTWTNDQNQRQEEVTFVDITLWGRQAELAQQYLTKGRSVFIEGRLTLDTWDDKATGQKRSKLRIVAENMQFMPDGKGNTGGSAPASAATQRPSAPQGGDSYGGSPADTHFEDEDEIPF